MILDTQILGEIQDALVEPNDGGATWPSGLWTTAEVVDSLNQHQRQFMQETQAVVTRSSQGIIPVTPRQPLPQSWIASRRIAFQPEGFDLQNGLVSFWRLNEAIGLPRVDSIGPNTLTDNNVLAGASGRVQGAANFVRASSQYLSITDAAQVGLNPGIFDFSFSLWFYPVGTTSAATQYAIIYKGCSNNAPAPAQTEGYHLFLFGSGHPTLPLSLNVSFSDSVWAGAFPGAGFFSSLRPTLNTWNHVAFTFDRDANISMWLNGVLETAPTVGTMAMGATTAACNPNGDFRLGLDAPNFGVPDNGLYWDGRIDACGYWNRLLIPAEVAALYNNGLGRELIPAWFTQHTVPTGVSFQALSPGDQFEMDSFSPTWATTPATRPTLYSDADPQTLEVVLLPPSLGNGTLHTLFVEQPTPLTGLGVPFSVPDEFVPTIKWGTIRDMLGKVGRAHDPIRASVAGEYYEFGVQAAKALMEGFAP